MIRRDVSISLEDLPPGQARAAVDAHFLSLDWSGDSFLGRLWLAATHCAVLVDDVPAGVLGWSPDDAHLSLLTLEPRARTLDRQVMEVVLAHTGARTAYVASWDAHHLGVFGAFAGGTGSQAYQFRLLRSDDLVPPVGGLELALATVADLDYLRSTGWQESYEAYVDGNAMSIARIDGNEVGIAVHEPHVLDPSYVDIGMYVDPV